MELFFPQVRPLLEDRPSLQRPEQQIPTGNIPGGGRAPVPGLCPKSCPGKGKGAGKGSERAESVPGAPQRAVNSPNQGRNLPAVPAVFTLPLGRVKVINERLQLPVPALLKL